MQTDLSVQTLAAHYHAQLVAAGWQAVAEAQDNVAAWSTWLFTDERAKQWNGTLIVIADPAVPKNKFVMLRAARKHE